MIKLYLVSAEYSSICVFYCDSSVNNLGNGYEVIGIGEFAAGSFAYDANGYVAIWDGTNWNVITEDD